MAIIAIFKHEGKTLVTHVLQMPIWGVREYDSRKTAAFRRLAEISAALDFASEILVFVMYLPRNRTPPSSRVPGREPKPDPEPQPGSDPDVVPPVNPEPQPDTTPDLIPPEPEPVPM